MKRFVFIVLLIGLTGTLLCQDSKVVLLNSIKIDTTRYDGISGSPYLFDEWKLGKVVSSGARAVDSVRLNYNIYTDAFEIRQDDEYIVLESEFYPLVEVYNGSNSSIFHRVTFPDYEGAYARVVYQGNHILIYKLSSVKSEIKQIDDSVKPNLKEFIVQDQYVLLIEDEVHYIKLKKRPILKVLNRSELLEAYVKKMGLSYSSEEDLQKIMKIYESVVL